MPRQKRPKRSDGRRRLRWLLTKLVGSGAYQVREDGGRCEVWVGGTPRWIAHSDTAIQTLASLLHARLTREQKWKKAETAAPPAWFDPVSFFLRGSPKRAARVEELPLSGPRWGAPLSLRCTVPKGNGEAWDVVASIDTRLIITLVEVGGRTIATGQLEHWQFKWDPAMQVFPTLMRRMIEEYLVGVFRVFAESTLMPSEWTDDRCAQETLAPRFDASGRVVRFRLR